MTDDIETLRLDQLAILATTVPGIGTFAKRITAKTYTSFVEALYEDLDRAFDELTRNAKLHEHDSEDRLSLSIVQMLRMLSYNATHEQRIGGHCDITVERAASTGTYLWIGEAKIHGTYQELEDGFEQLAVKYSPGGDENRSGGMIIYCRNKDAKRAFDTWRSTISASTSYEKLVAKDCPLGKSLVFFTTHNHGRTGLEFQVRHMCVPMYVAGGA